MATSHQTLVTYKGPAANKIRSLDKPMTKPPTPKKPKK